MSAASRIVEAMIAELHLEVRVFHEDDFSDELRGEDPPGPEEASLEKERSLVLLDVLDDLDTCSRCVVARLYGLDGDRTYTHEEVGQLLGMPAHTVSQIEADALDRLRPLLSEVA